MSESKHTPGPWTVEHRKDNGEMMSAQFGFIHGPKGKSDWVADVGYLHNDNGSGSMTNARLIAAAPELLAALSAILDMATDNRTHGSEIDMACAAIAKATGRE